MIAITDNTNNAIESYADFCNKNISTVIQDIVSEIADHKIAVKSGMITEDKIIKYLKSHDIFFKKSMSWLRDSIAICSQCQIYLFQFKNYGNIINIYNDLIYSMDYNMYCKDIIIKNVIQ